MLNEDMSSNWASQTRRDGRIDMGRRFARSRQTRVPSRINHKVSHHDEARCCRRPNNKLEDDGFSTCSSGVSDFIVEDI